MNPYAYRRPLRLTNADRDAWADYERRSRAAAEQYERMPIAHNRAEAKDPESRES